MKNDQEEQYEHIREIVSHHLAGRFEHHLTEHEKFLHQVKDHLPDLRSHHPNDDETLALLANSKNALLKLTGLLADRCLRSWEEEFQHFEEQIEKYINGLPAMVTEPQSDDRFNALKGDRRALRLTKALKKRCYQVAKWPEKTANVLRKLLKKKPLPLKKWQHRIPLQRLVRYYLEEKLKEDLHAVIEDYFETITTSGLSLWTYDEQIDKQMNPALTGTEADGQAPPDDTQELPILENAKGRIRERIMNTFELLWVQFLIVYEKAGTLEYSNKNVAPGRIKRLRTRFDKNYRLEIKNWTHSVSAMQDDWEMDIELYRLIYYVLTYYKQVQKKIEETIGHNIFEALDETGHLLENLKAAIGEVKDNTALKTYLTDQMPAIKLDLSRMVEKNSEHILDQGLPQKIDNIGNYITRQIGNLSVKRTVIKGNDYNSPKKASQLYHTSPYELINFECAPQLLKVLGEVKRSTVANLNEAENILFQLVEITSFNLESAISAIEETSDQEARTIALEGLNRTAEQLENVKTALLKINATLSEKLLPGILAFNDSAIKLTNNENLFELRVRIAKSKATEQSRQLRKVVIKRIKNFLPVLIRKARMSFKKLFALLQKNLKQLGIGTEKATITTELADFLAQTEEAIDSLPFVYQRLFKTAPLEDDTFFEGRNNEFKKLNRALEHWKQGRFAATVIIGERGSGISTLLNLYLKQPEIKTKQVRIVAKANLHTPQQMLEILNQALHTKAKDLGEFSDRLKKGPRRIIAIENLQHFFLKKVGGFDNIKILHELISGTGNRVFWIVGCTLYGFNYLDKTLQLSENFGYVVPLENLSPDDMINLIERRHKVSGYNLEFEPGTRDTQSKKINNLAKEEKTAYLKTAFFTELNKIAKSNIGIALIYWLRSARQVSDNTISIKSLQDIDFSFMKSLPAEKLHVLHMLMLHDGLSESEVVKVGGLSASQCRRTLNVLFENGITIKRDEAYLINPLLYRQTVNLLKTKNILH